MSSRDESDGKEEDHDEMTEEELAAWCSRYNNSRMMQGHILSETAEPSTQDRFVETLAELALVKDTPGALTGQYGSLYRWRSRFDHAVANVDKACGASVFLKRHLEEDWTKCPKKGVLPSGWKWMLQLRARDGKWVDWIYIQQSNRMVADLGVFSARDFPKGSTIGYYCGVPTWTGIAAGTAKPRRENQIDLALVNENRECIARNKEGIWQTVIAEKVGNEGVGEQPLYLGMHYVNTACIGLKPNSREYDRARKSQNCLMLEHDGCMKAIKKIPRNYELLTPWSEDEYIAEIEGRNEKRSIKDIST